MITIPTADICRLLHLDKEWKRIDREQRAATAADEAAVLAGQLDKEVYLLRAQVRQEAAAAAKQTMEQEARAILGRMTPQQKALWDKRN